MNEGSTTTTAPAARPPSMRRAAAAVGASAVGLRLVAELWNLVTFSVGLPMWSAVLGLLSLVVPIAGLVLLRRGDERGVVLLVVAGALSLPAVIAGSSVLGGSPPSFRLSLLAGATLVTAGVLSWMSRDRSGWAPVERPHDPLYVAAAAVVVVAAVLPTTAFERLPIGAEPWWQPVLWASSGNSLWEIAGFVLAPVVVAGVLWSASRASRPLAGAAVGALMVNGLTAVLFNLVQATVSAEVRFTPVGWLDLAAQVALLAVAARWWTAREVGTDGS